MISMLRQCQRVTPIPAVASCVLQPRYPVKSERDMICVLRLEVKANYTGRCT